MKIIINLKQRILWTKLTDPLLSYYAIFWRFTEWTIIYLNLFRMKYWVAFRLLSNSEWSPYIVNGWCAWIVFERVLCLTFVVRYFPILGLHHVLTGRKAGDLKSSECFPLKTKVISKFSLKKGWMGEAVNRGRVDPCEACRGVI